MQIYGHLFFAENNFDMIFYCCREFIATELCMDRKERVASVDQHGDLDLFNLDAEEWFHTIGKGPSCVQNIINHYYTFLFKVLT